jgi:hypothetical protein
VARPARRGLVGSALARLEEAAGVVVQPQADFELREAIFDDYRVLNRQLEDIGWSILDYIGGSPSEISQSSRRRMVQRARFVWINDPQAGAAVELMNDFCFGRGVPRPRCKDKAVQEWVDKNWDDPDNMEVLTTIDAQDAAGTDLALQSNFFLLMFDDGEDGMVKLSILRHDDVVDAIPDPEKRHRILWYVAQYPRQMKWNWRTNTWEQAQLPAESLKPVYYAHWRNVDLLKEEGRAVASDEDLGGDVGSGEKVALPPPEQLGDGKVYHLRINRYSEQRFGSPRFQRTMRWYTAYNQFVKDRLDVVSAAASVIMKRKLKATPTQLQADVNKLISRRSPLAAGLGTAPDTPTGSVIGDPYLQYPTRAGAIMVENESADLEPFNINSNAANAEQDAQVIRAPISAAERFPQSYFGDASSSNLATATSLELPVLKAVEKRQEVFEQAFRWFIDRVIERGVETGKIEKLLGDEELPDYIVDPDFDPDSPLRNDSEFAMQQALQEAAQREFVAGRAIVEVAKVGVKGGRRERPLLVTRDFDGKYHYTLVEYEDQGDDEDEMLRDLSYEFTMPSPLRRMMTDLISGVTSVAQTFDPNNTNPELSRALLTIALAQGFEVQDAPDLVDKIIPEGYVDPMVKAQLQAARQGAMGAAGAGQDQGQPETDEDNPYSAPMDSTMPEDMRSGAYNAVEAVFDDRHRFMGMWAKNRKGERVWYSAPRRRELVEAGRGEVILPRTVTRPMNGVVEEPTAAQARGDIDDAQSMFRDDVASVALDALDRARLNGE